MEQNIEHGNKFDWTLFGPVGTDCMNVNGVDYDFMLTWTAGCYRYVCCRPVDVCSVHPTILKFTFQCFMRPHKTINRLRGVHIHCIGFRGSEEHPHWSMETRGQVKRACVYGDMWTCS